MIENEAYDPVPDSLSPGFSDLIGLLLTKDPTKRITLANLEDNEWVNHSHSHRLSHHAKHVAVLVSEEDMANAVAPLSRFVLIPKLKAQMRRLTVKARDRLSVRRSLYGELMAAVRSDNVEGVQTLLESAGADVVLLANPPSEEVGCALGLPLHHGTLLSSIIPTNPRLHYCNYKTRARSRPSLSP